MYQQYRAKAETHSRTQHRSNSISWSVAFKAESLLPSFWFAIFHTVRLLLFVKSTLPVIEVRRKYNARKEVLSGNRGSDTLMYVYTYLGNMHRMKRNKYCNKSSFLLLCTIVLVSTVFFFYFLALSFHLIKYRLHSALC